MNRITTLVLLVLVAALGFFLFHKKENPPPPETPRILAGFDSSAVTEIFLESLERGTRVTLRRDETGWRLVQPLSYPAEGAVVHSILSPFEHNPCTRIADLKKRPDIPLDPYGLDRPKAVFRISQGGKEREVRIGKETLAGDQIFVLSEDQILQTSRNLYNATQRHLDEMRSREIFRIPLETVREFEVWRGQDSMRFRSQGGLWEMEAPWKEPAESAQVDSLLSALASIRVEKFFDDHPGPESGYGLEPPMYRFVMRDGTREDELWLGRAPTGEFLAKRRDYPFVWRIQEEVERLFQQSASEFRNRVFFRSHRDALEELRLRTPAGEMALAFRDGAWRMISPREYDLDRLAVEDLLDQIQRLQVFEFPPAQESSLDALGLEAAAYAVQLKARGEAPVRVLFGKRDEKGRRYARRDERPTPLLVEESAVPFLATSYLDYVDKTMFSFDERQLKRLELVRREGDAQTKAAWIRDESGIWRRLDAEGKPGGEEDKDLSRNLDTFLFWKGSRALLDRPEPGLFDKPWIEIRYFQTSAGEGAHPDFVAPIARSETGAAWTRGRHPIVFELSPKTLQIVIELLR